MSYGNPRHQSAGPGIDIAQRRGAAQPLGICDSDGRNQIGRSAIEHEVRAIGAVADCTPSADATRQATEVHVQESSILNIIHR